MGAGNRSTFFPTQTKQNLTWGHFESIAQVSRRNVLRFRVKIYSLYGIPYIASVKNVRHIG